MPLTPDGIRVDNNPVPLWERETFTLPQAAKVFGLDYESLRLAVNRGDVDVFRPMNRRNRPGRRRVRKAEIIRWIKTLEE